MDVTTQPPDKPLPPSLEERMMEAANLLAQAAALCNDVYEEAGGLDAANRLGTRGNNLMQVAVTSAQAIAHARSVLSSRLCELGFNEVLQRVRMSMN